MVDPDQRVSGKGLELLSKHNIEVMVGIEGMKCLELNRVYVHRIKNNRPYSILLTNLTHANNNNVYINNFQTVNEKVEEEEQQQQQKQFKRFLINKAPDIDTIVLNSDSMHLLNHLPSHISKHAHKKQQL